MKIAVSLIASSQGKTSRNWSHGLRAVGTCGKPWVFGVVASGAYIIYILYTRSPRTPLQKNKTEDDSSSSGRKKNSLVVRRELFGAGICKIYGQIPQKRAIIGATPKFPSTYLGHQLP